MVAAIAFIAFCGVVDRCGARLAITYEVTTKVAVAVAMTKAPAKKTRLMTLS
jgi:hypothetical protein